VILKEPPSRLLKVPSDLELRVLRPKLHCLFPLLPFVYILAWVEICNPRSPVVMTHSCFTLNPAPHPCKEVCAILTWRVSNSSNGRIFYDTRSLFVRFSCSILTTMLCSIKFQEFLSKEIVGVGQSRGRYINRVDFCSMR
jgi:hypothetical protein